MTECAGLEIRYTPFGYRGFESLTFRKKASANIRRKPFSSPPFRWPGILHLLTNGGSAHEWHVFSRMTICSRMVRLCFWVRTSALLGCGGDTAPTKFALVRRGLVDKVCACVVGAVSPPHPKNSAVCIPKSPDDRTPKKPSCLHSKKPSWAYKKAQLSVHSCSRALAWANLA